MTVSLVGSGALAGGMDRRTGLATGRGWLLTGALAGAGTYGVTVVAALGLRRSAPGRRWLGQVRACSESCPRPLRVALLVPAALGEELYWRERVVAGGAYRVGASRLGLGVAAYASVQAGSGNPAMVAGGAVLGLVTGALRAGSGSLAPGLAAHLVFSGFTMIWPGLPGAPGPELIKGRTEL
ncbi:MAG: CPBP family glutamic-type intramembrane protease [Candidatus Dormibacteria bacterium]